MPDEPTDTQKTQPKKGAPVEIPIPEKAQIMDDFEKIATSKKEEASEETSS